MTSSSTSAKNAALYFEPDGYLLDGPKLMGRQAAGNGFLRAAVQGLKGEPLYAYTPRRDSADAFAKAVRALDPEAPTRWIPAHNLQGLAEVGTLYFPGPGLGALARTRLRQGVAAYSLVGVTHTTVSHAAMDGIVDLLHGPVMPWDALICTSQAVVNSVELMLRAESDYLRWRHGKGVTLTTPQIHRIPLGVHTEDFAFTDDDRLISRIAMGIADDELVVLFVGRLSFHAKAHPHAMYVALEEAAKRSGKKVVLVQAGWFPNEGTRKAFEEGARTFAPSVRTLWPDGRNADSRRMSWSAADVFVSLSDNLQETFGLTPVEAMAAGLPVVATDWDGYRDTVRDGVDGFLIPTWMAPANLGEVFAKDYELGGCTYDEFCAFTSQLVSVDLRAVTERLTALFQDAELRKRLGASGQARAREVFEWSVVFRQYQELWNELGKVRARALYTADSARYVKAAPRAASSRQDPFHVFRGYPSSLLDETTLVALEPGMSRAVFEALSRHPLFAPMARVLPKPEVAETLFGALASGPLSVSALAAASGVAVGPAVRALATLGKMGLVRFDRPA